LSALQGQISAAPEAQEDSATAEKEGKQKLHLKFDLELKFAVPE